MKTEGAERFGPFGALRRTMKVFNRLAFRTPVSPASRAQEIRPKHDHCLATNWAGLIASLHRSFSEPLIGSSDSGLRWRIGFKPRVGLGTQDSDERLTCRRFYVEGPALGSGLFETAQALPLRVAPRLELPNLAPMGPDLPDHCSIVASSVVCSLHS